MEELKDIELCESEHIHEENILTVEAFLPNNNDLDELAKFYKAFGDLTRIKILSALAVKEMCVCDIANLLDMTISAISHQLKTLKLHKLVKSRKQGKEVFYSLDDEHVVKVLAQGLLHVKENPRKE